MEFYFQATIPGIDACEQDASVMMQAAFKRSAEHAIDAGTPFRKAACWCSAAPPVVLSGDARQRREHCLRLWTEAAPPADHEGCNVPSARGWIPTQLVADRLCSCGAWTCCLTVGVTA